MDKFHSQGLGWYCPIGPKYLARVTPCPAVCPTPSWWSRCSRCPRRPPSPGQWSPCHHDCRPPLHPTWTPAWRPLCRKHWSQCQEWDLQMIKITKLTESSKVTNGGVGIVVGASHKSASGVIQYGHHLHIGHSYSGESMLQHSHHILTHHSRTVETLQWARWEIE